MTHSVFMRNRLVDMNCVRGVFLEAQEADLKQAQLLYCVSWSPRKSWSTRDKVSTGESNFEQTNPARFTRRQ